MEGEWIVDWEKALKDEEYDVDEDDHEYDEYIGIAELFGEAEELNDGSVNTGDVMDVYISNTLLSNSKDTGLFIIPDVWYDRVELIENVYQTYQYYKYNIKGTSSKHSISGGMDSNYCSNCHGICKFELIGSTEYEFNETLVEGIHLADVTSEVSEIESVKVSTIIPTEQNLKFISAKENPKKKTKKTKKRTKKNFRYSQNKKHHQRN